MENQDPRSFKEKIHGQLGILNSDTQKLINKIERGEYNDSEEMAQQIEHLKNLQLGIKNDVDNASNTGENSWQAVVDELKDTVDNLGHQLGKISKKFKPSSN